MIVEQSNLTNPYSGGPAVSSPTAQTFTVGVDGILSRIDLQLVNSPGTDEFIQFDLRSTTSGIPSLSLFSTTINPTTIPQVNFGDPIPVTTIDVSSLNLSVTSGDVLAISLSGGSGFPPWTIWATHDDPPIDYTGGNPTIHLWGMAREKFSRPWLSDVRRNCDCESSSRANFARHLGSWCIRHGWMEASQAEEN